MLQTERPVQPSDRRACTAKTLIQRLQSDVYSLAGQELEVAKLEAAERVDAAASGLRNASIAYAFGLLGIAALTVCGIVVLASVIGLAASALVLAVVYVIAASVFVVKSGKGIARLTRPIDWSGRDTDARDRLDWTRSRIAANLSELERKTDVVAPLRETALGMGSRAVALNAIVKEKD